MSEELKKAYAALERARPNQAKIQALREQTREAQVRVWDLLTKMETRAGRVRKTEVR